MSSLAQSPDLTRHFDYDARAPLGLKEIGVERRGDVRVYDITYNSPKGGVVPAYLVVPQGKGPFAGVIWGHWYWANSAMRNRKEFGVNGATDVTGFALLGHAWELARASGVSIQIDSGAVPLLHGALALAAASISTGADKTNREYVGTDVSIADSIDKNLVKLFYDPQTAGGMLISISADRAADLLARLKENYPAAQAIGKVVERGKHSIRVE